MAWHIYYILIISAIVSTVIILTVYLHFYNREINERLQNNIKDRKPLPDMRKVTLITTVSCVLICTIIACIIAFVQSTNSSDTKSY